MKIHGQKSSRMLELYYSTKKLEHSFTIPKALFRPTLVRVYADTRDVTNNASI